MSPERDTTKMKCLLLLLIFRLVLSDKLDRTYLPPPSAKFAGGNPYELQAPIEYLKPNFPETVENGLASGISQEKPFKDTPINENLETKIMKSKDLIDYSPSNYPAEFGQRNSFSTSEYDSSVETVRPDISSYNSFPQKPPNSGYLPSKQSTTQQPYLTSTFTTNSDTGTDFDAIVPGYYYGPALEFKGNTFASVLPNSEFIQYPNEVSGGFLSGNELTFTPKPAATNEVAQNYQPSAFGYYGGNPMIMTAQNQKELKNTEFTSKFGEKEDSLIIKSVNQNKQNTNNRTLAQPFQTPLVRTNMQNIYKSRRTEKSTALPPRYTGQSNLPTKTTSSFIEDSYPRLRPERPQAESDRSAIVLNYDNAITPEAFLYSFDTSNGIHVEQSGTATNGVKAKGSYSFTGDDGKVYSVSYTADENGFQPRGDHLPTPPPVPEAIKRLIEVANKNRAAGIFDDGSYDEKRYGHMNYQGAMDRYRSFKNSEAIYFNRSIGNKVYRPTNIRRRPNANTKINDNKINGLITNTNVPKASDSHIETTHQQYPILNEKETNNKLFTDANKNDVNKSNIKNLVTTKRRPFSKTKDIQQNISRGKGENKLYLEGNKAWNNNIISAGIDTELKPIDRTEDYSSVGNKFKNPSGLINNDNYTKNENNKPTNEIFLENQKSNLNYKPESNFSGNFYDNIQNSPSHMIQYKSDDTDGATFTDDGYYYVPPIITFSPIYEKPAYKKNTFTTNTKTAEPYVDTIASKRIAVDSNLNLKITDGKLFSTPSLSSKNNEDSTRKPYISGPHDRSRKDNNDGKQTNYPLEKRKNELKYTNDLDSSTYLYTTTPMSSQNTQYTSLDEYPNQYYQTTTYPAAFEPTLPNSVNRDNIYSEIPGVKVSQDFVTTTYRPTVLNDGVLEVNQNVKIYGLGRPESTVVSRIPVKISSYNNGFYTTTTPKEEFGFVGANPDRGFAPVINQGYTYANEFHTTASPVINTGPYANPNFETNPREEIYGSSEFENAHLTPGQEHTTSTDYTQNLNPTEGFIGEDFSGPKQPQWFNPASGYYY